jgi:MoxR-like ATPase
MDQRIVDYIVDIVHATRYPAKPVSLIWCRSSSSAPARARRCRSRRRAARMHSCAGRAFVTPEDVKAIAPDVLRHRVLTTYEAEAEEVTSDDIVKRVLDTVRAP